MSSESKATRTRQKAEWEAKLERRTALLSGKGIDEKKIARDVLVKELKSKIRESQVRLEAIAATVQRTEELAAAKAARLAAPKEEAPKPQKATEPPAEEAKPKKKKKKEEGAQSQT